MSTAGCSPKTQTNRKGNSQIHPKIAWTIHGWVALGIVNLLLNSPYCFTPSRVKARTMTKLLRMKITQVILFHLTRLGCRGREMPELETRQQREGEQRSWQMTTNLVSLPRTTDPVLISQRLEGESRNHRLQKKQSLKENCLSQPEIYESAVTVGRRDCKTTPGYCTDWLTPGGFYTSHGFDCNKKIPMDLVPRMMWG